MNFLPCAVRAGDVYLGRVRVCGAQVCDAFKDISSESGESLKVGIRPGAFTLDPAARIRLSIRVEHVEHLGNYQLLSGYLETYALKIKLSDRQHVRAGETLEVGLNPQHLNFYRNEIRLQAGMHVEA
jgi:ABC-type sugar transport system ATPase subunit